VDSPRTVFDPHALLAALEAKKAADGISWRELAARAGMPHSYGIAGKLRRGAQPSAGVLVLLLRYLGTTDLRPYITNPAAAASRVGRAAPAA
jgi:transcriptional regulator with XRE-family HTH domain